ncbi:proton-conducting transporter membrane subunit [Halovibrio sp. HP20-50]|uniref:proton-conducting transporter transmembrane domain-containing protein n=1 Tax=Halovibrio sp. HP20-59 TaxID=3080275 RepID=UPI00294B9508|nr:proton-conducting transporter membrane subunit [Halovibrio sp. HP20-59]MEA2117187.1 proton-conducting transporter membrane subunit [Halovibrio sp. HP20-59]
MMTLLLALSLLWPLGVAGVVIWQTYRTPSARRDYFSVRWLSAAWPALLLAYGGEAQWTIDAWMLGGEWELNALSRPWLAFTALLWSVAALHARGYFAAEQAQAQAGDQAAQRRLMRLALLWPLTLLGNVLLIIAQDIASFYLGFALMTFAAYALVVHTGTEEARLGARAYLILAVVGEGLILGGFLWSAGEADTLTLQGVRESILTAEHGAWMAALLCLGLGVKAGVIGLHVWLPLAHPAAPAPASAVLSGAMIKAGLLGWISVLPLGEEGISASLTQLGQVILVAGLAAAFGAALYGVFQRHPKAVLAYSSISQMGMMTALVATGLVAPAVWPLLWPGVVLFAAHHALAKGSLFMGTSISEHLPRWPRALIWPLLALPGISLTGAIGAGMVAKWGVKSPLYEMHHETLIKLLSWAAVGTAALVGVAIWRQWQQRHEGGSNRWQWGAWLAGIAAALATPLWLPLPAGSVAMPPLKEWLGIMWPLPVGVVIVAVGGVLLRYVNAKAPPAGDLWWLYAGVTSALLVPMRLIARGCGRVKAACVLASKQAEEALMGYLPRLLAAEPWMRHHASGLMMVLAVLLAALLMWEGQR